ncbi:MAG: DUF5317 domain-containing protein [Dehalococcoidia bacterium]|nr:DUF5317 domain-containing protein [Dehalococcoidia bacterium]
MAATSGVRFPSALRWGWLGVAALLAQIWAVYFAGIQATPGLARRVLLPLTFVLLLVFALRNWHLWGVRVMAVGFLLNLLVIGSNGGLMPITPAEVASVNLLDRIENVQLGEPVPGSKGILMAPREARLWFLSDIIVFPPGSPIARVFSVGDLLVLGGVVIACAEVIRRNRGWRSVRQR